jgi:hypothetical protein
MQNLEKWGIFLRSATADVELRSMAIAMPLHPVQGKGVHRGKLFPEYCRGLWGAPKSKNFTRRSRARHLQHGADGKLSDRRPCSAQFLCVWRALPTTKIWIPKNITWRNCSVLNFSHAAAFRCVTLIHSSQGRMTFSGGGHRSHRANGTQGWE